MIQRSPIRLLTGLERPMFYGGMACCDGGYILNILRIIIMDELLEIFETGIAPLPVELFKAILKFREITVLC